MILKSYILEQGGNKMNIQIESRAMQWFQEEMNLQCGDFVHFVVRYGGNSTIQSGDFS